MPVISGFSVKMLWFTHIAISFVFQKWLTYYISHPSIFHIVFIGRWFKSVFLNKTRWGWRFAVKWVLIISLDIKGLVGCVCFFERSLFLSLPLILTVTHSHIFKYSTSRHCSCAAMELDHSCVQMPFHYWATPSFLGIKMIINKNE